MYLFEDSHECPVLNLNVVLLHGECCVEMKLFGINGLNGSINWKLRLSWLILIFRFTVSIQIYMMIFCFMMAHACGYSSFLHCTVLHRKGCNSYEYLNPLLFTFNYFRLPVKVSEPL